ncbi:hypothetical protein TSAR_005469 [Trichomalopsis sarcophagae]|uniref:Methyltransferase type 12 domain-containing protein n=1 Tax=Trichomalopsis sarcophagae TaxID=543379 RepID=A0A232F284_9HYME|nr:hypothetical protein TSAR_005469 [Trichomalopsis sarcophagae]
MDLVGEYIEAHDMQIQDALDVIEEFSDEIAKMHGQCIDIGCGPGSVTRRLLLPKLPTNTSVVGGDVSKKMIDFARTTHADEKRLSFTELDISAEKLPPHLIGGFDNAVSFYCLHWCPDARKSFENIYQLLRPGGKGLVLFIAKNNGFDSYLKLHDYPEYKSYMKDVSNFIPYFNNRDNPRAKLKKIIEESGFEVLHCSYREKTFIFESIDILKKHVVAVNPFIARMPEDMQEKYTNDLMREIVKLKITFVKAENGSTKQYKVLDRYNVLIAYFKKPAV